MRGYVIAAVVLIALYAVMLVGVARVYDKPSPPPDVSMLSNDEYLDSLGTANDVLQGCVIFLGNGDDMKTLLFLGDGQDRNRLTAVCVPND